MQRARRLAVGVAAGSFALSAATCASGLIRNGLVVHEVLYFAVPLSWTAVGAVVGARRPSSCIGWLCLAIGTLLAVQAAAFEAAYWTADHGWIATAGWVGLLSSLWLPALGLIGTHLLLRLPVGVLATPRWRWWSRLSTTVICVTGVLVVSEPGPVAEVDSTSNPIGSSALATLSPLFLLLPVVVAGAALSLVLRYRRAGVVERLQLRWIGFAAAMVLLAILTTFVPTEIGLAAENSAPAFVEALLYLAISALPVAIGVSVLRYRLYDIDVVINRTLVYGSLTATLATAYLGAVVTLQLALGVTQSSDLAVAASTLAVAALFRPARTGIQEAVDRRFYRSRYDAGRTLHDFTSRLRQQVDLGELDAQLRDVVQETMQPAHVSLWLREAT